MVNLEETPLDGSIVLPGAISGHGHPGNEREKTRHRRPTRSYRTCGGSGRKTEKFHMKVEERHKHLLFDKNNKVHKTTQRRRHRMDWLCGFRLEKGSVPRGSLIDSTMFMWPLSNLFSIIQQTVTLIEKTLSLRTSVNPWPVIRNPTDGVIFHRVLFVRHFKCQGGVLGIIPYKPQIWVRGPSLLGFGFVLLV